MTMSLKTATQLNVPAVPPLTFAELQRLRRSAAADANKPHKLINYFSPFGEKVRRIGGRGILRACGANALGVFGSSGKKKSL